MIDSVTIREQQRVTTPKSTNKVNHLRFLITCYSKKNCVSCHRIGATLTFVIIMSV